MHGPTEPDSGELHIAIVGGGASGTLTAVQLLRHAGAQDLPVHITLIDRHGLARTRAGLLHQGRRASAERHGRPDERAAG